MTVTLKFPTEGTLPPVQEISSWLTEQGEPFEFEGGETIVLRALPVRVHVAPVGLQASVNITATTPLPRLVRLVFDLSMRLGSDVHVIGPRGGPVHRAELWLRLSDEQDRLRIADALEKAASHHVRDEILSEFWAILAAVGMGRDIRWDFQQRSIVEIKELPRAQTLDDDSDITGTLISLPVEGPLHVLAWRWMAQAYPSLATQVA